jgi:hypothetical protein
MSVAQTKTGASGGVARSHIMLERLRFTLNQALYLLDSGVPLNVDISRSMLMTASDADAILAFVPRNGRTAMSIRRKVAEALRRAEIAAEVRS